MSGILQPDIYWIVQARNTPVTQCSNNRNAAISFQKAQYRTMKIEKNWTSFVLLKAKMLSASGRFCPLTSWPGGLPLVPVGDCSLILITGSCSQRAPHYYKHWLGWCFTSHSTQNRSFRRPSSQPISASTEKKWKTQEKQNTKPRLTHTTIAQWTHTHTHPFNGPFSGTTQVSWYQKGKTNLDFTEARDSEWQWHQLGHMQVCTSLQTDNHTNTPPLSFLQDGCPSCRPTNSVKALKAQ